MTLHLALLNFQLLFRTSFSGDPVVDATYYWQHLESAANFILLKMKIITERNKTGPWPDL